MSQDFLQELSEERSFYPLLSEKSSSGKTLTGKEYSLLWESFDALPLAKQDILGSSEIPEKLKFFQKKSSLSLEIIAWISAIIREYFVLKRDDTWLKATLSSKLDPQTVPTTYDFLQQHIFTIKPEAPQQTKEEKPKTVQLPLLDAMGTYPKIGEQMVTHDRITVRGESGPVRGTIRSWLRAYRDTLGVRKHTSMERGQFLFQNDNTRRLPKDDRLRLSAVLKSLDDRTPLEIDTERQEIRFSLQEESIESPRTETNTVQPETSRPTLSISPPDAPAAFRPVGNRLRIASAHSQHPEKQAPAKAEAENSVSESESLSSAVYGDIASTPTMEETSEKEFRFSANHILPHEKASALGIERYQREPERQKSPTDSREKNVPSVGTDTFSPETPSLPATENPTSPSASRKNFGNLVNLRDT